MRLRKLDPVIIALILGAAAVGARMACGAGTAGASADTYTRLCYNDVAPLYTIRGLADGIVPYLQAYDGSYLEYPVLTGLWMWATAAAVRFFFNGPDLSMFVVFTWLTSLVFVAIAVAATRRTLDYSHRALWFALSPAVFLVTGINWDALPVMCVALAMMWWSHDRRTLAGIALGLGAAAKLYPALLLIPFIASLRGGRSFRQQSVRLLSSFGFTWLAVNLPVAWLNRDGWLHFYAFSRERGIDFGSFWLATDYLFGWQRSVQFVNNFGLAAVGATALLILLLGRRLDWVAGSLLIVGVFVLVNKVYSPQYWLWLAPLVALAVRTRGEWIGWNLVQAGYFIAIWRYLLWLLDPAAPGAVSQILYSRITLATWAVTAVVVLLSVFHSLRDSKWRNRSGRLRL